MELWNDNMVYKTNHEYMNLVLDLTLDDRLHVNHSDFRGTGGIPGITHGKAWDWKPNFAYSRNAIFECVQQPIAALVL
jgi:hypothetical protein